jgi:hypothetical protein
VSLLLTLAVMLPGGAAPPPNVAVAEGRVPVDRRVAVVAPYRAKLMRMAGCESTWRWHIFNPPYSGGLQFDKRTWYSVGGRAWPHENSRLEQMYRAVLLVHRRGFAPWPICGSR